MNLLTAEQARELDRAMTEEYAYPSLLLMEQACRETVRHLLDYFHRAHTYWIFAGKGNNGGDGLGVARMLAVQGKTVHVVLCTPAEALSPDAQVQYAICQKLGLPATQFADWKPTELVEAYQGAGVVVVDALLGTGLQGEVNEPYRAVLELWQDHPPKLAAALDLPSGLEANTGRVQNPVLKAELTVTYHGPKPCHYLTPASEHRCELRVADIGVFPQVEAQTTGPATLLTTERVAAWLQARQANSHKGAFGHLLLVGGSRGRSGAVALSAQTAMEAGVGLTTALIPGSALPSFHRRTLEQMSLPAGPAEQAYLDGASAELVRNQLPEFNALAIGPGLGQTESTRDLLAALLPLLQQPAVLDADALNLLAAYPDLQSLLPRQTILTPHPGEMARLMDTNTSEIQQQRLEHSRELAQRLGVIVVLKGSGTVVAQPNGHYAVCPGGNAGMATAGAGDVLTGIIGALLALGYTPERAAGMGVWLHAEAGDRLAASQGQDGLIASKLMREVPHVLHDLRRLAH